MSDFFESQNAESAAEALERGLRRDERRHLEQRKMVRAGIAVAVAGAVLLGGGIAAMAAVNHPTHTAAVSTLAVAKAAKPKKKAKHKKKSGKRAASSSSAS